MFGWAGEGGEGGHGAYHGLKVVACQAGGEPHVKANLARRGGGDHGAYRGFKVVACQTRGGPHVGAEGQNGQRQALPLDAQVLPQQLQGSFVRLTPSIQVGESLVDAAECPVGLLQCPVLSGSTNWVRVAHPNKK
jgi:hypothetical protein